MTIELTRFCINRKIAPALSIEAFFKLVHRAGLNKVELRNDMHGGKVTDNLSYAGVRRLAERYHLEIVSINALYPFNQLNDTLLQRTAALLEEAKAVGSNALVLCPLNDGSTIATEDMLLALKTLAPLFQESGIQGLVEPLGFSTSSLRSMASAQALIRAAQLPFRLVLDTFHHYLYEAAEDEFDDLDIHNIGLVHISGVIDPRPTGMLADEQRLMLSKNDRLDSIGQVQRLEMLGYRGIYAFEPFSSTLETWHEADIEREIHHSIALLQA
nr:TIM barrel protein [Pantoea sp. 201603H]